MNLQTLKHKIERLSWLRFSFANPKNTHLRLKIRQFNNIDFSSEVRATKRYYWIDSQIFSQPEFRNLSTLIKQPIECIQIYTGSLVLILVYIFNCLMVKDSTKNIGSFKLIHQTKSVSKIYVFIIYLCFCLILISMHHLIPSSYLHCRLSLYQKRFYNRETNSAAFFVIKQMSIKPPSLLCNSNNSTFS